MVRGGNEAAIEVPIEVEVGRPLGQGLQSAIGPFFSPVHASIGPVGRAYERGTGTLCSP